MRLARVLALALTAGGLVAGTARADVKPHPLFTDNVVLQQGGEIPVWGKADPGEKVTVELARAATASAPVTAEATADKDGKWKATLPKQAAGTGYTLAIRGTNTVELKNVAVGEVWVASGQSNMEWSINASWDAEKFKAAAKNPNLRLFTVQKRTATAPISDQGDLKHFTTWSESGPDTIGGFSAVAYHFGSHLQKNLPGNVPVGMIHTSWGGTPAEAWTSTEALEAVPELKHYAERAAAAAKGKQPVGPNTPASLYNAMIHPLLPFAIKGAIWYQGESNAGRAAEYRTLFPTMIEDWRKRWGHEFPFLCVQLAPFNNGDAFNVQYAELRDAQLLATKKLKNVGMAVITDVGDLFDIHPKDKLTVGTRLALCARGMTYGQKVVYSGPIYKGMEVDGSNAVLSFDHLGGGLCARTGPVNFSPTAPVYGFEICGEDKEFYPAKGAIKGDSVVVSSPKVSKPVAVRFGWQNFPLTNLYNKSADGRVVALPASPFRTDDFPLTTAATKK
jgi:sialate O-acetylesterase